LTTGILAVYERVEKLEKDVEDDGYSARQGQFFLSWEAVTVASVA
jgi:hypothetical protein